MLTKLGIMVFAMVVFAGGGAALKAAPAGVKPVAFSFVQEDDFPWAHPHSLLLLQEARDLGVTDVTAEVHGYLKPDGLVTTVPISGLIEGINDLLVWTMAARNLDLRPVIKLAEPTVIPEGPGFLRGWNSYLRWSLYHAKLGERAGAAELAIPGGIAAVACSEPGLMQNWLVQTRRFYHGPLRVDFKSLSEYQRVAPCLVALKGRFEHGGLDLTRNPNAIEAKTAIEAGLILTRVDFTDVPRLETFLKETEVAGPEQRGGVLMTFGPFRADPNSRESSKPVKEGIRKWLSGGS